MARKRTQLTPEQQDLFDANTGVADRVAAYARERMGLHNGLTIDDYRQISMMGLCRAILALDKKPANVSLQSFLFNKVRTHLLDEVRKADEVGRSRRAIGIEGPISIDQAMAEGTRPIKDYLGAMAVYPSERAASLERIGSIFYGLLPLTRAVMYMHIVQEMPVKEIAAVVGIRQDQASEALAKGMEVIQGRPSLLNV
ncbi:MAG: hypothetical protein ABFD92_02125 [Planctomycetaceae bacterium]|nr:hypothetical protein [Planctomycetaceae bacterium]